MADENIVTNIVANADFSGLIADVNKVTASLSKLQAQIIQSDTRLASQVATMNRSFGENLRRTGQFSTHFVTLTSDVEKFGTNLDRGQMKLRQYFQTFQQHTKTQGGLIRDLAKQQVALQNAIIQPMGKNAQGLMQYSVHIPQGLDAVKNKAALAKQELQIMNKVIQDGGVQMINWGKNTQWAGRQLTVGLTVPLAAFGKAAADAFRMADAELVRLTKVYGGVAATSAAELSKIRNEVSATAKEISKAYGVSFKDTITLAADIAATGKQGDELLASVKETSRLAVLGEVDRQEAMKATLAIQTTFKQNTDQLSESINFLNSVENQTSTTLNDLVEAIPKAGPVIQGLGGSVQDLALYLTAMKEGGINASEGANALKSALASLINPTKVAKEKFSEMGIDLGGIVAKNAGNLTGTLFALQEALDQLDPLQKQQAIEQLFGKFQFSRLNALFANLGKQGSQTLQVMDLMKASSQELAQVAGRELSMVTESASGKYKRAVEGLKADLAGIGDEFLKIQTFFINIVDGIVKFINKLPDPIKSVLTFVTGFTAIIGPVIMLTGVLANFFGYIIKGASHFRALFKGGEGWKMLTPEILAAQKAGSLVEATFYSDAKAATVLKTAIAGLVTEFELLQSKAMTGAVSVAPAMSTMAGNLVKASGGRVVDPNHPLISPEDTRSMSHLNPVAGMTTDQRAAQTIFGVVPGAPKVNQKIGNNPQIYMEGDLPKIPGLTSIGGASTGVVAEEAAKWHAMTGALAMQSQAEIALLKKEVATTGLITSELSDSYQALLPTMTKLTANAAAESAAIVAQLQAGKLTVDQARAKIIQLNAQVEAMMTQASIDIAGQQGRSISLTSVPLLDQPVVNKDGKSNMKELARPGRTRDLLNKIARGLGVKTFGAGYSTETTIPKRFNRGNIVPGTGNTDTVPAMLTPGEFVVNKEATAANLPLLEAINGGKGSGGPNYNKGGKALRLQRTHITDDLSGLALLLPAWLNLGVNSNGSGLTGSQISSGIRETLQAGYDPNGLMNEAASTLGGDRSQSSRRTKAALEKLIASLESPENANRMIGGKADPFGFEKLAKEIYRPALRGIKIDSGRAGGTRNLYSAISQIFTERAKEVLTRDEAISRGLLTGSPTGSRQMGQMVKRRDGRLTWVSENRTIGSRVPSWARGTNLPTLLTTSSGISHALKLLRRNSGGMIPGYNAGGVVGNVLKSTAFKNVGAKFGKIGEKWGATSLSIGMGRKLFGSSGLTPKAQNLMYGKLVENLEKERPYGYVKDAQGSLQKALEPDIVDTLLKSAAGDVLSTGGKSLSKIDREILRTKFANWDSKSWTPSTTKVRKQMFGMNKGGMVPGVQYFNRGGKVKGVQYLNEGSVVKPITFGSAYREQRDKGFIGKGLVGGPMAGMGVGMGMQMAGGAIGGQGGQIMQFASVIPMLAPNMLGSLGKIATGFKGVGGAAALAGKLIGIAFRVGPLLAVTGAIAGAVAIYRKFTQEQEQNRLEQSNSNGITKKSAEEAGIQYNNLSESIKSVNQQLDLTRAKGRNAYEALNSSGVQGLTLSIKELKDGIKNAKENQKELVATFSNIDVSGDVNKQAKVTEIATNLKAQFVAAGMTAQEATNKIYAIISASDKAGMAFNAISGKGFREIVDASSAANAMITKLNSNMDKISGKDLGESLSNIVDTLDLQLDKLMKTKKANGDMMTQQEAMVEILDDINLKKNSELTLTQNQVNSLKESHPELAAILNQTDNVAGVYAKWRVLLSGVRVDLKNISSDQAQTIATFQAQIDSAIESAGKNGGGTGILSAAQKSIISLQKLIAAGGQKAAVAAQKTQDQIKEEIKLIDKKIDKINEEANARKKALEAAQNKENLALEIQKAQLEYADKLAAGDMAGAAQAQLKIKQLVGERETQKAIDAIEENRAKREKELIAQREKLQNQADKAAKNLTNAQNNAATSTTRMNKVAQYSNEYERLVKESINISAMKTGTAAERKQKETAESELRGALADLSKMVSGDAKGSDKVLATELKKIFGGKLINKETGESQAGYIQGGKHPKSTVSTYVPKGADTALANDAKAVLNMAESIKGGATLYDVMMAIKNDKGDKVYGTKATAKQIDDNTYDKYIQKDGSLSAQGRRAIMNANKLGSGQYFTYEGKTYKGNSGGANDFLPAILQKASGGYISGPGTGTSDSIPAMLSNGEFVINAKSASSFGYGNLEQINKMAAGGLATKFNIPSYSTGGRIKYADGGDVSRNSNVTINATLNFAEAPKNGRELWKEFKEIARSEGAKVGESVLMGRMN